MFYEIIAYAVYGVGVRKLGGRFLHALVAAAVVFFTASKVFASGLADWPFATGLGNLAVSFGIGVLIEELHRRGNLGRRYIPFWASSLLMIAACAIPESLGSIVDVFVVVGIFPFVIIFSRFPAPARTSRFGRYLGEISYPLYILHWPLLLFSKAIVTPVWGAPTAALVGCVAAILLSAFAFYPIDVLLRRKLLARFLPREPGR